MKSSVLIITDNRASDLTIGVESISDLNMLFPLTVNQFETIIVDSDLFEFKELQDLLKKIETQSLHTQKIISISSLNPKQLLQLVNQFEIFRILETFDSKELEKVIVESKETFYYLKQNEDLIKLYDEQNKKLQGSRKSLEDRIKKRQEHLESLKQKALESSEQLKTLVQTIIRIQTADSFEDIEIGITQMLSSFMYLRETQIIFNLNRSNSSKNPYQNSSLPKDQYIFTLELEPGLPAYILYKKQGHFKASEKKLLRQISEAVALTINKILVRQKTETLKKQWESTFQSIIYPIAIIDENFNLLQFNKKIVSTYREKCFQILFNRNSPCENCQMKKLGGSFKISDSNRHVEVLSQNFSVTPLSYVNVYKDITEEVRLENQILEKAKISELGIIGSSIAHELNNPLSGIIVLLQMINNEISEKSKYKEDILQMQNAAENCRRIIENLLSFSRISPFAQSSSIDIKDLIYKIIHLAELKTKPRGVYIKIIDKGSHHALTLQTEIIQQVLTKFLTAISETVIKDMEIKSHKILETNKSIKSKEQITILLNAKDSFYKIIVDVFLIHSQPLLSDIDISYIASLMAFLGGGLNLRPYDGEKAQAELSIPFTKEPKSLN